MNTAKTTITAPEHACLSILPLEHGRNPVRRWSYGDKEGKIVLLEETLVFWTREFGWRGDSIEFQDIIMREAVEWLIGRGDETVADMVLPIDLGSNQTKFVEHLKRGPFKDNICPLCNSGFSVVEVIPLHKEQINVRTVECTEHGIRWQEDQRGRRYGQSL